MSEHSPKYVTILCSPPFACFAVSLALYVLACALPALRYQLGNYVEYRGTKSWAWAGYDIQSGISCAIAGFFGLLAGIAAWLANPLLLVSWVSFLYKKYELAALLSSGALFIALLTLRLKTKLSLMDEGGVQSGYVDSLLPGFYLWIASIVCVYIGAILFMHLKQPQHKPSFLWLWMSLPLVALFSWMYWNKSQDPRLTIQHEIANNLFSEPSLLQAAKAALQGDRAALELLKKSGLDINQQSQKSDSTLLNWAVLCRNVQTVKLLLDEGADPNINPDQTIAPLASAAYLQDPAILKMLLDRGGNPNLSSHGLPLLFDAAKARTETNVWILLDHSANIDAVDTKTGETVTTSAMENNLQLAFELLQRGASYNHLNHEGKGVVWHLIYEGTENESPSDKSWRLKIKEFLESKGANLNVPRNGPPPQSQWPAEQQNDPYLLQLLQKNLKN